MIQVYVMFKVSVYKYSTELGSRIMNLFLNTNGSLSEFVIPANLTMVSSKQNSSMHRHGFMCYWTAFPVLQHKYDEWFVYFFSFLLPNNFSVPARYRQVMHPFCILLHSNKIGNLLVAATSCYLPLTSHPHLTLNKLLIIHGHWHLSYPSAVLHFYRYLR